MRSFTLAAAVAVGICLSAPAGAQLLDAPISVEVAAGALVPLGDWTVRDRETSLRTSAGPLVSAGLRLGLPAGFSTYGSYRYALPGCDDCDIFGLDSNLVDAGFGFGVGYALPEGLPVDLRADLGALVHQLSFRGGGQSRPSDWGFGGEIGVTGSYALGPSLLVEPAVSGRFYPARYAFEEGSREVSVSYLAPRVGLRYSF